MAKTKAFEKGQRVRLRSGGPIMTVQTVPEKTITTYRCQWFAGKKLENGTFPPESLVEVSDEEFAEAQKKSQK